jgi:excinuclease ABC subunit B
VNLLREGLDLPEVSLVAVLDADKEGFLRSETSLIQTIGRAARHVDGKVLLYADVMTGSLTRALAETDRRRAIQTAYNTKHGITPQGIHKSIGDIRELIGEAPTESEIRSVLNIELKANPKALKEIIKEKEYEMKIAAAELRFETARILRDEIVELTRELKEAKKK